MTPGRADLPHREVLFTREPAAGGPLLHAAERLALRPLVIAALRFGPGRDLARLAMRLGRGGEDWVAVTSAHAAAALAHAAGERAVRASGLRVAALGEATAAPLRLAGIEPTLVAQDENAASLADAIVRVNAAEGTSRAVIFLRGNRARRDLPERLAAARIPVEEIEVYVSDPAPFDEAPLVASLGERRLVASVIASPSAGQAVLARLAPAERALWLDVPAIAPGATTAAALASLGMRRITAARGPSEGGLADALTALLDHPVRDDKAATR